MAFPKTAFATTKHTNISWEGWSEQRQRGVALAGHIFDNRTARANLIANVDPSKFLLSHCTIVSSVDTESGPGDVGVSFIDGFQVNRRFKDYYVTTGTQKYANNNHDAFERKLLLATFKTFVGGENYVEHIQIPEMSKGKILDAVARDIGESIYIDILVATDRKHTDLVASIEADRVKKLSMGANVLNTTCTRCGNCAEDDTQLCPHVRYMKGAKYFDSLGAVRRIVELCGHYTDPKSVRFIEASWVGQPAFEGAERRATNALTMAGLQQIAESQGLTFEPLPIQVAVPTKLARTAQEQQMMDQGMGQGQGQAAPPADPFAAPIKELTDKLQSKAIEEIKQKIDGIGAKPRVDMQEVVNDTFGPHQANLLAWVQKMESNPVAARRLASALWMFRAGGWTRVASLKLSGAELLKLSQLVDALYGVPNRAGEQKLYACIRTAGGLRPYASEASYLAACRRILGRDLLQSDMDTLIAKGRIFDLGH